MDISGSNITFNDSSKFVCAVQHNQQMTANLYLTLSIQITTPILLFLKRKQEQPWLACVSFKYFDRS